MIFYSCNCALPSLTNGTKCCELCSNNPNKTYVNFNEPSYVVPTSAIKPLHTCEFCGEVFMADDPEYCPKCGKKITKK